MSCPSSPSSTEPRSGSGSSAPTGKASPSKWGRRHSSSGPAAATRSTISPSSFPATASTRRIAGPPSDVAILPDERTGEEVFDFEHWDARALYFHDPAGNIGELVAHRGIGGSGATGPFLASEFIGLSEVGIVGEPASLAEALARELALEVWSGTVGEEGRLAFVGEKARTLILSRAGRPWLPTWRPAEAHPVEIMLVGPGGRRGSACVGGFRPRRRASTARLTGSVHACSPRSGSWSSRSPP